MIKGRYNKARATEMKKKKEANKEQKTLWGEGRHEQRDKVPPPADKTVK